MYIDRQVARHLDEPPGRSVSVASRSGLRRTDGRGRLQRPAWLSWWRARKSQQRFVTAAAAAVLNRPHSTQRQQQQQQLSAGSLSQPRGTAPHGVLQLAQPHVHWIAAPAGRPALPCPALHRQPLITRSDLQGSAPSPRRTGRCPATARRACERV